MDSLVDRLYGEVKHKGFKFSGDPFSIRPWLNRRFASMQAVRIEFESLWKDIRQHIEPGIAKALEEGDPNQQNANRDDEKILDSMPRELSHRYADGMQSGVTNPANNWFEFVQERNDDTVKETPSIKKWFEFITQQASRCMQRSNVYRVTNQVYLHAGIFGTSCALLLHGVKPGSVFLHLLDEGDYWIAENKFNRVDTLIRRMRISLSQAVDEFGLEALPEKWADRFNKGDCEGVVNVLNLICRNVPDSSIFADVPKDEPFASFYWSEEDSSSEENRGIIRISHFSYNPIIAYRHEHSFGSVYGHGIGERSLPDIKQLNFLVERFDRLVANETTPPMQAPASMKGRPINMTPGGISYYDPVSTLSGGAPIQRLFQTSINPAIVVERINVLQERIRTAWHGDLFGMMLNISTGRKDMTAREVEELSGEKVALLGPILTGMNDDFLNPLMDGIFTILFEDGFLEDESHEIPKECLPDYETKTPPEIEIGTEFISTIHTESYANIKMRGIFKLLDMVGMIAQVNPDVVNKLNTDQVVDEVSNVYRTTSSIVRSDKETENIRNLKMQEAMAMQQQQQMAELAKTAGQNAKALSETPMGNGSALDQVVANSGALLGV